MPIYLPRLLLSWFMAVLAAAATAQTTTAPTSYTVNAVSYTSALSHYQPYTDPLALPWRQANDQVGKIGGWRAYAKEISSAESTRQAAPAASDQHPTRRAQQP